MRVKDSRFNDDRVAQQRNNRKAGGPEGGTDTAREIDQVVVLSGIKEFCTSV
jgi:chorismate synthase